MSLIDILIIVFYILGVTIFGAVIGRRTQGLKGYFFGGGNVPMYAVMISIVATETSTATFLSVPGIAYKEGGNFTFLQLAMGFVLARIVVAIFLLPSYFRGQIYSAYEVLQERFGGATKSIASVLFLMSRTLGDGLRLYLAALVLRELLELSGFVGNGPGMVGEATSMLLAIILMGVSTIVYTYLGGMKAVVWTDVTQFVIYMIGAVVALTVMQNVIDGGFAEVLTKGEESGKFQVFDFTLDLQRPYTFWSGVIGGFFLSTATHGADQMMVQRYLSSQSQRQAATALIASGFVVLAQFALFLFIGVCLWTLFGQIVGEPRPEGDQAFAFFLVRYMPTGLLGLVVAAIFSAAMSTLSSSLNASSSSTVNDLIRPRFPGLTESRLLQLSKLLTIVWGLAQMGVAYFAATRLQDSVVNNALTIASFTFGILLGLFVLGLSHRQSGQTMALAGMVGGLTVVSYTKFGPFLPAPWYPFRDDLGNPIAIAGPYLALIGSVTTVAIGAAVSRFWYKQSTAAT